MTPKAKINTGIFVVLCVVFGLFFIGKSGLYILSGLRSYVNAEALWSKGQKEAAYQLIQYVFTQEESKYQAFIDNLKIPLGDTRARLELQKPKSADAIAFDGFTDGGNHPEDIPKMIFLFKYFQGVDYVREAIKQWEIADLHIEKFLEVGKDAHYLIVNNGMNTEHSARILSSIDALQKGVTSAEVLFSYNISEATRWFSKLIFTIMIVFTVIGSIVCFFIIRLIAGISRDLITSEERSRLVIKGSNDAPWDWKLISNELYYSPQWWAQLGYEPGELPADSTLWERLMHPDDAPNANSVFKGALENNIKTYEVEFRLQHKDGHYVPVLSRGFITRDKVGNPIRVTGTNMDLSEREKARKALFDSEQRYRRLTENAPDMIYRMSLPDGKYEYVSPAAERIFGYSPKEFYDTPVLIKNAIHPDWSNYFDKQWALLLSGEMPPFYECQIIDKFGETRWLHQRNVLVKSDSGNPIAIEAIVTDITERKKSEEEKLKLESQLQQAQKMEAVGTLAGGIAHDFNNILGAIIGHAELGKMKLPGESEAIDNLDQVLKAGNRAAKLVKQILTISRQHKQEQRPVQIKYIVREVLKLLRSTLPTTIEIKEDLVKESGIVQADPTQMHQVIMNLCTNAGQAMQEDGGVLTVELANVELDDLSVSKHLDLNAGSYLRLTVSDTGHGMSREIMERIFDPYFTTKDTMEGTGLGLSVAHGIVKAHGGTITVYSEPGKGTTFHVYLPVILVEESEEKKFEEPLPTGNERILIVDDEQTLVEIGSQMLGQLGYEVVTQKSSIEALELFRAEPDRFDLVITDMTMPHMTGDKLAQELMKIRPDMPIIICTGFSPKIFKEKAQELGIKAFVMKPLVRRDMANIVRKVLDGQ